MVWSIYGTTNRRRTASRRSGTVSTSMSDGRIWTAQAGIVLPYTHRILRSLIQRYRDVLDRLISRTRPFRKTFNERTDTISGPGRSGILRLRGINAASAFHAELHLIKTANGVETQSRTATSIHAEAIERLSDLYVDNFDLLETDVPGWNCRVAGQTLTMTVGPSGAEKARGPRNKVST